METPFAAPEVPSGMPVQGRTSSSFAKSRLHPIDKVKRPHKGEDIAAPRGTPVRPTAAGVTYAGRRGDFGNLVEIKHSDVHRTRYAHLDSIAVAPGQSVERGVVVGAVGATGKATGPHLHYEVLVARVQVDPAPYL